MYYKVLIAVSTSLGIVALCAALIELQHKVPTTSLGLQQPISMIVVRACGKAQGVLAVTADGVVHNLPGPFTEAQKDKLREVASHVKDQEHSLVSIEMPCNTNNPDDGKGPQTQS